MAVKSEKAKNKIEEAVTRSVTLQGITDIMFDRYPGDNNTKLDPEQKFYFSRGDKTKLILPALNILSFLSAENTTSAPKRLLDIRKYKAMTGACRSFVSISPMEIPFIRNGQPIHFGKFKDGHDELSGAYVHVSVARLEKGVPNPKERPVLPTPWELHFDLTIEENDEINEQSLVNIIKAGGKALGLGTFRGVFGKFRIVQWE